MNVASDSILPSCADIFVFPDEMSLLKDVFTSPSLFMRDPFKFPWLVRLTVVNILLNSGNKQAEICFYFHCHCSVPLQMVGSEKLNLSIEQLLSES